MESKRKNVYIALFVITTIIAGCVAVYFGIMGYKEKDKVQNLQAQITELENQENNNEEINKEENNNSDNQTNTESSNEKIVEKVVEKYSMFNFDASNCINRASEGKAIYSKLLSENYEYYGIVCNVSNNVVNLRVDMNKFNRIFLGTPNDGTVDDKEYKIDNFDGEIADIYLGNFGQAAGYEILFFLMKDGTVEYMPLRKIAQTGEFKSYGKIKNVTNIVSIQTASSGVPNGGGWVTTVAFNNEGKFYDLKESLEDMGENVF